MTINYMLIFVMCRHVSVALEMLLKLVAVFGPVIHSTISAPPAVGVNLQAERRFASRLDFYLFSLFFWYLMAMHK